LFDGKDLSTWAHKDGTAAKWKVGSGYFETVPKTGYIYSKKAFGDLSAACGICYGPRLRLERVQDRGNSGVFLMGLYEIQVLDSYNNRTYADGSAAAVYGQYPPLVNASRAPGSGRRMTLFFMRRSLVMGKLVKKARVTVIHNGVLVQDNVEIQGTTSPRSRNITRAEKLPLALQDHNHPVRYRNIWVRELGAE